MCKTGLDFSGISHVRVELNALQKIYVLPRKEGKGLFASISTLGIPGAVVILIFMVDLDIIRKVNFWGALQFFTSVASILFVIKCCDMIPRS